MALGRVDQSLLSSFRTRGHSAAAERGMRGLGSFGQFGIGWTSVGLIAATARRADRVPYLRAAAVAPAAVAISAIVKLLVGRSRPILDGHPPLAPAPTRLSFPSGHTTSAFAAAGALSRIDRRLGALSYGLAVLIGAGRPYLGMHYPSDVLAGAALGWAIGRTWPLGVAGGRAGDAEEHHHEDSEEERG